VLLSHSERSFMLKVLCVMVCLSFVGVGSAQDFYRDTKKSTCSRGCGSIVTKNTKTTTTTRRYYRTYYSLACLCYKTQEICFAQTSTSTSCGCTIPIQTIQAFKGLTPCPTILYNPPTFWTEEIVMRLQQWMSVMPSNFLYHRIT
jgi:hypothetical protein